VATLKYHALLLILKTQGVNSFRDCVIQLNSTGGTITFDPSVTNITLTSELDFGLSEFVIDASSSPSRVRITNSISMTMQGTLTFLSLDLIGPGYIFSSADLFFTNTTITGLSSSPGGNTWCIQGNAITISNSSIDDNPGAQTGGIFYTQASLDVSKTAVYNHSNNGIIFYALSNTNIEHCTFTGNQIYSIVYENDNSVGGTTLAISSSTISNNVFSAAAVVVYKCHDISLTAITFTSNSGLLFYTAFGIFYGTMYFAHSTVTSNAGGAIVLQGENAYFYNNTFTENSNSCGLLTINEVVYHVQIESCNFTSNSAINAAGAAISFMYMDGNAAVLSCTFINNTSDQGGGAIYFYYVGGDGVIYSSTFTNNSAPSGGAVYVEFETIYGVTLQASTFTTCSATSGDRYGGAVYSLSYLTVKDCVFTSNTASSGGAIWGQTGLPYLFTNNIFSGNTADSEGGALWAEVSYMTFDTNTFVANQASSGGGAFINGALDFDSATTFYTSTFEGNRATVHGGAMVVYASSNLNIKYSTFDDNTAPDGYALYISPGTPLRTVSTTFWNNAPTAPPTGNSNTSVHKTPLRLLFILT